MRFFGSYARVLPGETCLKSLALGSPLGVCSINGIRNSDGTLDRVLRKLQSAFVDIGEIDNDLWCIDGTIVRAARCASGGGKKAMSKNLMTTR